MTYDEMILRGPEERPEPVMVECEACHGWGFVADNSDVVDCTECDGAGEVFTVWVKKIRGGIT